MRRVTKQAATRDLVLDLIEQLAVGDAIPSERQLSADFGVSRLTVRAALDDLVREGYLVRRHGSGTFVSEPKIAQELTMTSFTDDMRRRGLRPASETLDLRDRPGGSASRPAAPRLAVGAVLVADRLRLADGESMAIETVHIRASHVPGLTAARSRGAVLLRAAPRPLRDRRRRRRADDRADRDRRGRVGGARRAAALAGVSLRARHALARQGRSSSSSSRSTAATGTVSSRRCRFRRSARRVAATDATTARRRLRQRVVSTNRDRELRFEQQCR